MIDLTGKSVFVKTQGEYLSVIKMAKLQGFTWAREDHLNPIEIPFPNLLNFYSSKVVTYRDNEKTLCEASEIVEDEEKIKDAVKLVRTFAEYPDGLIYQVLEVTCRYCRKSDGRGEVDE